jgi:galacturonosyltransferase
MTNLGAKHFDWSLNRHSKNPFIEFNSFNKLKNIFHKIESDYVLSFTIKPNIYSGILSRFYKFKHIPNITGLGQVFSRKSFFRYLIIMLYKISFKKSKVIFLQNSRDLKLFEILRIHPTKLQLLPGSGVNIEEYTFSNYPSEINGINFLYLGRVMEQKGFYLYINAAKFIKSRYKNINFMVCGFPEKGYEAKLNNSIEDGTIEYKGNLNDIKPIIQTSHCLIQPSYYPEGISNVILEASSMGRPVITSDNVGCGEAVMDKKSGLIFQEKNLADLISKIELFINLNTKDKVEMGLTARENMVKSFNRKQIIEKYFILLEGGQ